MVFLLQIWAGSDPCPDDFLAPSSEIQALFPACTAGVGGCTEIFTQRQPWRGGRNPALQSHSQHQQQNMKQPQCKAKTCSPAASESAHGPLSQRTNSFLSLSPLSPQVENKVLWDGRPWRILGCLCLLLILTVKTFTLHPSQTLPPLQNP